MPSNSALHKKRLAIAISAALAGVSPMAYSACAPVGMTYTVDTASDVVDSMDGLTTLREAITAANANPGCDTIDFDAALSGPIVLDVPSNGDRITIADDLNINGPGSAALTIQKESTGDLSLFNHCNGDLDISGLTIDGNDNNANYFGINSGPATSGGECGALLTAQIDSLTISDLVIQNIADSITTTTGTAVSSFGVGSVSISDSRFINNDERGLNVGGSDSVTVSNVTVSGNGREGIEINSTTLNATADLSNITASGNRRGVYATFNTDATLTLSDSVLASNNQDSTNGAGLGLRMNSGAATITVSNTTIDNNTITTSGSGAGIHASFTSGTNGSSLTIENSTVSNNTTVSSGAGIGIENGDSDFALSIHQSTISGNTATGDGGGIYFYMPGCCSAPAFTQDPAINFSTITNNTGNQGGGLWFNEYAGDINLSHTVLAGNTATSSGPDYYQDGFSGGVMNAAYSFIGEDTPTGTSIVNVQDSTPANTSMIGSTGLPIDPLLAALADNGGDTLTHAPLNGSMLIDGGDSALQAGVGNTPARDQRDRARVAFTGIDVGAVEFNTNTAPTLTTPITALTAIIGTSATQDLNNFFTDAEMDSISYSVQSITPAVPSGNWSVIGSEATGTFQAGDEGTYTVVYEACDTEPFCTTATGTITVSTASGGSSMISPWLAGLLATVLGLFRLRRR